jgi:hypothetical protein
VVIREITVDPGSVVTDPGSSVVTVTAGCVVVMTSVVVKVLVLNTESVTELIDTVT